MSAKGCASMVHDGYIYNCNNQHRKGNAKHFTCESRGCRARLNTIGWDRVTGTTGEHSCPPTDNLINRLIKWYLYQELSKNTNLSPTNLVVKAKRKLSDENLLMIPEEDSLVKYVCDKKRELFPVTKSASKLSELLLNDSLKVAANGDMFLLHDDGPSVKERIICYGTKQNMEQLKQSDKWLCDGTFAVCPKLFYQLWVVHATVESKVLPFAYFLLPGATEEIYTKAFKILQDAMKALPVPDEPTAGPSTRANPDDSQKDAETLAQEQLARDKALGPAVIIMDYETAQYNAFKEVFDGEVQGCFFHYRQAITRRLQQTPALSKLSREDTTGKCKSVIQKLVALAFVKPDDVGTGFMIIERLEYVLEHVEVFAPFLEYFEGQWVGKIKTVRRGQPRAKVPWNCHAAVLKNDLKTTSNLEAWHKHLKSKFGQSPRYNTFFNHLKVEQEKTISVLKDIEVRPTKKKRFTKGSEYQKRIHDIVKAKYKKSEIGAYIDKIAATLTGNMVEKKK